MRRCADPWGRRGSRSDNRGGFQRLVAEVGLGHVGLVLGIEVSRLARRNADWYNLMDLCALTDTLIADGDGVYHPGDYNSRLVLGFEGHDGRGRASPGAVNEGVRQRQRGHLLRPRVAEWRSQPWRLGTRGLP